MSFGGADLGTARGKVDLDVSGISRAVSAAQRDFGRLEQSGQSLAQGLSGIATTAGIIGAGISLGIGVAVKTFASFDGQMAGVAASLGSVGTAAGITEEQFEALREAALEIGANTTKSANEAALAMELMAKAGVGVEDILNGAAEAAVNISEATGDTLAQSAETMSAFLLLFKETGITVEEVADIIVTGMNASSATMSEFQTGITNLAPAIKALGVEFDEAASVIAFFNSQGLSAARVGTDLSMAMLRLVNPPKESADEIKRLGIVAFDTKGVFIGFPALFDQLARATRNMTDEQKLASLSLIFSAGALDTMAVAVEAGGAGIEQLTEDMNIAGSAAEASATRMDSLAGAFEQARGSIETAAISFGSALAPAMEAAAVVIGSLADGFSSLPGPVQQTAAGAIAAAGGFALLTAATAKTVAFSIDAAASFGRFASALANSRRAMTLFAVAINPITLAIAAAGVAAFLAIKSFRDHRQAVADLAAAYEALGSAINDAKLGGDIVLTESLTDLESRLRAVNELTANANDEWIRFAKITQASATDIVIEIDGIGISFNKLRQIFEDGVLQQQELAEVTELSTRALNTQGIEVEKVQGVIDAALADYELFVRSQGRMGKSGDDVIQILRDLNANIGDYAIGAEDAATNTDIFVRAWEEAVRVGREAAAATKELREEQDKLRRQADETVQASLNAIRGLEDIAPGIDGLQEGFGRVGDSLGTVLLKLAETGAISLDPAVREALELQNALEGVEAKIISTESAIENNADDMSMWQGRINLVNETLGTEEDELVHLNQLLNEGRISQQEYDEILEAGIFIRERATGALVDEREEQARQLPILAEYIRQHDAADGSVRSLTDAQQGFLAAMQSSQGQTALQTLELLAYLAATDLIPPEKVTEFIADASAADPIVAALFDDLGLLESPRTVTISAEVEGQERVNELIDSLDFPAGHIFHIPVGIEAPSLPAGGLFPATETGGITIPTAFAAPDDSAVAYTGEPIEIPTAFADPSGDVETGAGASVEVAVDAEQALADLGEVESVLGALDGRLATATVLVADEAAKADLSAIEAALDAIDERTATPLVSMSSGEGAVRLGIFEDLEAIQDDLALIDEATATPSVSLKGHSRFDLSLIQGDLDTLDETTASPTVDLTGETFVRDTLAEIRGGLDDWPTAVSTTFGFVVGEIFSLTSGALSAWPDAVTTTFEFDAVSSAATIDDVARAIAAVQRAGDAFAGEDFRADLSADPGPFRAAVSAAHQEGGRFAARNFRATVSADASPAISALSSAFLLASAWDGATFSARVSVDTSPVLAAVATVREAARQISDLLPSSPAKKGPLAREISFAYVADALAKTARELPGILRRELDELELPPVAARGFLGGDPSRLLAAAPAFQVPFLAPAAGTSVVNVMVQTDVTGNLIGDGAEQFIAETAARHIAPAVVIAAERAQRAAGTRGAI